MIRNLKAVGLLAFAALAMSAMFASAASAQQGTFTAGTTSGTHEPATLVGHQDAEVGEWNFFQRAGSKTRCHEAEFTGTDPDGTATELTITPHYRHCYGETGGDVLPATVTPESCDYVFKQPNTDPALDPGQYTGKVDLTCDENDAVVIHFYGFGNATQTSHFFNACTVEVFPNAEPSGGHQTQELGGHVIYTPTTTEGKDAIFVETKISGITSSSNCPGQPAHDAEGLYDSTVEVWAFEDDEGEHTEKIDAWISDEEG